jgi:outer membrane protein OmpA-like peptidoglycan-associated protein
MYQKTVVIALLAAALFPAAAFAYIGVGGGRGLVRVQSAMVEEAAGLTVGFDALGRKADFDIYDRGVDSLMNKTALVADVIGPAVCYAPVATKYVGLELFGAWGGVFQLPKSYTEDGFTIGAEDIKVGGKLSVPVLPVLKLGFMGNYPIAMRDTTRMWADPIALPFAQEGFAWRVLGDLRLQDVLPSAPNLFFNYGKAKSRNETAGRTEVGAGLELAGKGLGLFVEALSSQPDGRGVFDVTRNDPTNPTAPQGHIYLTPGIVLGSPSSIALKLAYTLAWGWQEYDEALLGLTFATGFGKRVPAQYGSIAGSVMDEITGAPVAANITFPDNPKLQMLMADASTGLFTQKKIPVGSITVEVTAEGYRKATVPIAIENNKVTPYEFKLKPLVVYGSIAGVVTDAKTGAPLDATLEFPGSTLATVTTNAADGSFRVPQVPVGAYTVTASAKGYIKGTQSAAVEQGKPVALTFALNQVPVTPAAPVVAPSILTGVVKDKKTGTPVAATIKFPGSTVADVTTDTMGVYKVELMPGSYAVQVEAQGYVNQVAAIVIEKGKPLVRDFELVKEGMAITLKGIYFDLGKATIKPESKEALSDAAKILKDNPSINVEIQGHTDNIGSDESNLTLSDKRAWAVVNYLVDNFGIDRARLTAKGYGESRPIADNGTAEGRAQNRRVEFVILSK